ncbi:MAG: hypothetical protein EOO43_15095 [Flavobacterium sp.]|nr:MAG: hypothetical protein EOO43_15095 [Flavobacterium sp.]
MDDFVVKPIVENTIIQSLKKWLFNSDGESIIEPVKASELAHFDPDVLQAHFGDDTALISEILILTKTQLAESQTSLQEAFERKQLVAATNEAHKIYGTAVSAGFPKLAKLAREFEISKNIESSYMGKLYSDLYSEINICIKV